MAYYLKSGNTFRVSSKEAMDLHEQLPPGNYVIKEDPFHNLYLEHIDDFEIKGKRYGDLDRNCDRIINTFLDRTASTGVMLNGEKGSGKSLLAKAVSIASAERDIPTIIINAPWTGDRFFSFMQNIDQPCVVLFDEFEKVYNSDDQEHILTLLDGVFPSRKLFVLTCNDKWRVDQHMRNRPGRIYYMLDFKGLTADFIIEYCEDNLNNQSHIERIVQITSLFHQFNFDMLKALVEEMNRYDEAPEVALKMLNAKPEFDEGNKYTVKLSIQGVELADTELSEKTWNGNPLQKYVKVHYKKYEKSAPDDDDFDSLLANDDEEWSWEDVTFTTGDLKKIESDGSAFTFFKDGFGLKLTKVVEKQSYYYDAF